MNKNGFTLVETMVAITIVTIAISGAFFSANSSMVASSIARDKLTASYLAQQGIEYVRMIRDNNYLTAYHQNSATATSVGWSNFISSIGSSINYPVPSWASSSFTRTVQAIAVSASDEKIISTVSWNFHGIPHTVTVTDHLTPWQ